MSTKGQTEEIPTKGALFRDSHCGVETSVFFRCKLDIDVCQSTVVFHHKGRKSGDPV